MKASRIVISGGLAVTVFVAAICGAALIMFMSIFTTSAQAGCSPVSDPPAGSGNTTPINEWSELQVTHAWTIVAAGQQANIPARGWVIALATAMQESALKNYANSNVPASLAIPHDAVGSDHDSVGLFQQRPSPPDGQGSWGSVEELMTPAVSAGKFYTALTQVQNWQGMDLAQAAQAVQKSAFPDAYAKWEIKAGQLAAHVLGIDSIDEVGGGHPSAPCGDGDLGDVVISPGGWTAPVVAVVSSGFRTPTRPDHHGVDFSAERGTPIVAAGSGRVIKVRCNSSSGTCDRDGSPQIKGCGWYVEVLHAGDVITRYCHMQSLPRVDEGQQVNAGTILGFVGSSGRSSGPHLHYEVHLLGDGESATNANAISPIDFHMKVGAPLGG